MTDQETSPGAGSTVPALPTEFTIHGRTYELVPFLKKGESSVSVSGDVMVERAVELNANLGEEDGAFILERQDEIPPEFRGKFCLVFTAWRGPSRPPYIAYLDWGDVRWSRGWGGLDSVWGGSDRLVRRVS